MRYSEMGETGKIRKILEMESVPVSAQNAVDEKLQKIYSQLPDNSVRRAKNRVKTGHKKIWVSFGTVASALTVLLGMNAVNPVFAEKIPLVGGFFKYINARDMNAETVDTVRLEEKAEPIQAEEMTNAGVKNELYEIRVVNKYYDGRFVHTALEMDSKYDPTKSDYYLKCKLSINGKLANTLTDENEEEGLLPIFWIKTGENSYIAEAKYAVPKEYRTGDALDLSYSFSLQNQELSQEALLMMHANDGSKEEMLNNPDIVLDEEMDNSLSFSVTPSSEDAVNINSSCENEGAVLHSFYSSPAGTEISVTVPMEGEKGTHAQLFTLEGKEIGNIGFGDHAFTGKIETAPMEKDFWFGGLKEEYRQAVLRLTVNQADNESERYIEFLIDIDNSTVTPSSFYSDKTSKLYFNKELEKDLYPIFYATYRAEDSELPTDTGYKLEYLSSGGVHKNVYMTIAAAESYRDLKAELYVNGDLRSVGFSENNMGDSELEYGDSGNKFMPLADYVYDEHGIALNEDGSYWIIDSGYLKRDTAQEVNIYTLNMGDFFFELEDEVQIKIYDSETGEILHEEQQTMTIPAGVEVLEGQQIYKKAWSTYAVADTDMLS